MNVDVNVKQKNPICAINTLIAQKGLMQKAVALKAGFSEQQFSDMLNGRKVIRAEYIPLIAKALEVTPNDLFITKETDKSA